MWVPGVLWPRGGLSGRVLSLGGNLLSAKWTERCQGLCSGVLTCLVDDILKCSNSLCSQYFSLGCGCPRVWPCPVESWASMFLMLWPRVHKPVVGQPGVGSLG